MISLPRVPGSEHRRGTSRLIAAAALCAAVALGTTGCGLVAEMGTAVQYSPSDGIDVRNSGPLEVRNALIVVDEEGTTGNLVAAIVNMTDSAQTLNVQVGDGSDAIAEAIRVKPNTVMSLGAEGQKPLRLEGIDAQAGSTLPVFFQSGDAEGVNADVPVLNGELRYLSTLVPTPAPTFTVNTPAPTPTPTP